MPSLFVRRSLRHLPFVCCLALLPVFGACETPNGEDVGSVSEAATPRIGCDYSFAKPSAATVKADGFTFAARYLSNTPSKNLTAAEAKALIAEGIDVVSNWEAGSMNSLDGKAQGVTDATAAQKQALACGMPASRPIYFSVDFDAQASQQAAIDDYFDGVASVLGVERTGAYGGYNLIKRLFDAGKIKWGWQAFAWSNGQWDSRAQMRQVQNGVDGGSFDKDEGMVADFGQWGTASAPGQAEYAAEFSKQSWPYASEPAIEINEGGSMKGSLDMKNTGTKTWKSGTVKLAPTPRDKASDLAGPTWLSPTRVSTPAADVAPGAVGHFELDITGNKPGNVDQFFGLVAEGEAWFSDPSQGGPDDKTLEIKVHVNAVTPPAGGAGGAPASKGGAGGSKAAGSGGAEAKGGAPAETEGGAAGEGGHGTLEAGAGDEAGSGGTSTGAAGAHAAGHGGSSGRGGADAMEIALQNSSTSGGCNTNGEGELSWGALGAVALFVARRRRGGK